MYILHRDLSSFLMLRSLWIWENMDFKLFVSWRYEVGKATFVTQSM